MAATTPLRSDFVTKIKRLQGGGSFGLTVPDRIVITVSKHIENIPESLKKALLRYVTGQRFYNGRMPRPIANRRPVTAVQGVMEKGCDSCLTCECEHDTISEKEILAGHTIH